MKLILTLMMQGIVLSSCQQVDITPESKTVTTSVKGYVYHKYYRTPMAGVQVNANSYRSEPDNFVSNQIYEILDSTITDANGYFEMEFKHQHYPGSGFKSTYFVDCPYQHFDSSREFRPGRVNAELSLSAYNKMIVKAILTARNVNHQLEFVSVRRYYINNDVTDTTFYYGVEARTPYKFKYEYFDKDGKQHRKVDSYLTPDYKDTVVMNFYVDASSF